MKYLILLSLFITACSGLKSDSRLGPITNLDTKNQLFARALTVCDPLDGDDNPGAARGGLQGQLYYLTPDMPRFTTVEDYVHAIDTGTTVFLNDVNVPTRMFDRGFPTADGSLLRVGNDTLVEWFELFLETQIKLDAGDLPGRYQLAMIADDGAVFEIMQNGNFVRHVDDDGTHSSRLACASSTLTFDSTTRIPARVKYYQGPRTEIALMLLWRPVTDDGITAEPLCGATGQNLYFEYHNNPSTPQQAYLDLLSRGWAPLKPGNFELPGNNRVNPCNTDDNWANF